MPRGRPKKKLIESIVEKLIIEQTIETKPLKVDNRIPKNLVPIKYNEDLIREIRGAKEIYPITVKTMINKTLLMVDWFVNTLDSLDSTLFVEDGGWKNKYGILPPRVNLPKELEEI